LPEYRELLDWLAVDFMEHGWSRRRSAADDSSPAALIAQSSAATEAQLERDPQNQLLARGARYRADAEVIRDIALTAAGMLQHQQLAGPA
jgi:hypothetical protein